MAQEPEFPGEQPEDATTPGYGDQGPAGQGRDPTGGTSVTGEDDADEPAADFDVDPDADDDEEA